MNEISFDKAKLPRHVGIIMDGNGRWAKKNKIKIALGHRAGTEALREIIRNSSDIGIEALSLYAFSTENWSRSKTEVDALMGLLLEFFTSEIDELHEKNVRILILGEKDALPPEQRQALTTAELRTYHNTGLRLNIAINYGGRAELARAARLLAREVAEGLRLPESIDEAALEARLYTAGMPTWICSSAPAEKCGFPVFCCGSARTRSSFFPQSCGRTLRWRIITPASRSISSVRAALAAASATRSSKGRLTLS